MNTISPHRHSRGRALLELTALAGLVGLCWRAVCTTRDGRRAKTPRAVAEHIQTWEGEGGGVPVSPQRTAAQVDPAAPA